MKTKILLFWFCFLSIFFLTGCFEKKESENVLTVEQFKTVAEKYGLKSTDNLWNNKALSGFTKNLEEAKKISYIKNIIVMADIDLNDLSKPFYIITFIESTSKEYSFESYDYYKIDSIKKMGKFKKMPNMSEKCKIEDLASQDDFKKCKISVLDFGEINKVFGNNNMYKIYAVRDKTLIYCSFFDRDTEKVDKMLAELGY